MGLQVAKWSIFSVVRLWRTVKRRRKRHIANSTGSSPCDDLLRSAPLAGAQSQTIAGIPMCSKIKGPLPLLLLVPLYSKCFFETHKTRNLSRQSIFFSVEAGNRGLNMQLQLLLEICHILLIVIVYWSYPALLEALKALCIEAIIYSHHMQACGGQHHV